MHNIDKTHEFKNTKKNKNVSIIKVACPYGIITASDTREVYSTVDKITGKKNYISHIDGVNKSFLKNNISIAIVGNAYIGQKQIKDFFPDFLSKLDDEIKVDSLINEISNLYTGLDKHRTKYYLSFYDKAPLNSKYITNYKIEPYLLILNTENMNVDRINCDEDGFTFGFFWGGENGRISTVLTEKRAEINTNTLTIQSSIQLIKNIFIEVQNDFKITEEYPTVSEQIDITIQSTNQNELLRNYK